MEIEQNTFSGGSNLLDIDTALDDTQYRMLINGRQRYGEILPTTKSIFQTGLPTGNYQGGIDIGNIAVVFVDGNAYTRHTNSEIWTKITEMQMDATAPELFAVSVPASTQNYVRKRGDSVNAPMIVSTDFTVAGNPAGLVVQDGLTQPWLIQFNAVAQVFVARLTKTYVEWSNASLSANDREYVPIGRQMFTLNQKLYIVAPDKKSIYQSVTGRPLDFMMNVDSNGAKLPTEAQGGAATTSFVFDSDEITCVREINLTDSFIYGTIHRVRVITLNYDNTIFGEPTYRRAISIDAGIVNQNSFLEILGDYAFVDNDGIKLFNAVSSIWNEGRNSYFSANISKIIGTLQQTVSAAINFDNYALFYCKTTLGNAIVVYDQIRKIWCSIDITTVTKIKKFFVVASGDVSTLYAVTESGVWEMYNNTVLRETCYLFSKAYTPTDTKVEHKGQYIKPIFRGCTIDGTLVVTEYVDEQLSAKELRTLTQSLMAMTFPISFPIGFSSKPNSINDTIVMKDSLAGKKIAYVLSWNTDAALRTIKITTSEQDGDAANRQLN